MIRKGWAQRSYIIKKKQRDSRTTFTKKPIKDAVTKPEHRGLVNF